MNHINAYNVKQLNKAHSKPSELLLYICIIVAPLRCYGLGSLGWGNLSFFRLFGMIMIALCLFDIINKKGAIQLTKSMIGIVLILLSSFLCAVYSTNLTASNFSVMVLGLFWLFFAMIIVHNNPSIINKLIGSFIISAAFPVIFGIYQYLCYYFRKTLPPFPLQQFLVSEGKTGLIYRSELRIMSFFLDPSYYGMFLIAVILVLLCVFFNKDSFPIMNNKIFLVVSVLILIMCFISLITTLSITAFLGLLTGILLLFLFNKNKKAIKISIILVILTAILLLVIDKLLKLDLINIIVWRIEQTTESRGLTGGRTEYIASALDKWLSSPIFGVGFGDLAIDGKSYSAHNSLITILGQQGLAGIVFHLYFLIFLPIQYFFKKPRNMYSLLAFIPIMGILMQSMGYDLLYKLDSYFVLLLISFTIPETSISRVTSEEIRMQVS